MNYITKLWLLTNFVLVLLLLAPVFVYANLLTGQYFFAFIDGFFMVYMLMIFINLVKVKNA